MKADSEKILKRGNMGLQHIGQGRIVIRAQTLRKSLLLASFPT
jgi:hypothetical protein